MQCGHFRSREAARVINNFASLYICAQDGLMSVSDWTVALTDTWAIIRFNPIKLLLAAHTVVT